MPPLARPRRRHVGIGAGVLAVLVVLLLSHTFGRAEPTNSYRPLLPPAALATGCFPLPGGAELDLSHQIRRDGDVRTGEGERRILRGQYNLVDRDEAERRIVKAFTDVGFREVASAKERVLRKPGAGVVRIRVSELPGTSEATIVRGEFRLDLPVVAAASDDPVCDDPRSTKRWGRQP